MPDRRKRRGPDPRDEESFGPAMTKKLEAAVGDLSWLLTRGYARRSALELVGNRYQLLERQRKALGRSAAADQDCARREAHRVEPADLAGQELIVDGFNVLLTLETALSSGVLLEGRDGVLRDIGALSAHYRRLHVTRPAVDLLVAFCAQRQVAAVRFLLDRPISNSGRLRGLVEEVASGGGVPWSVELADHVDSELRSAAAVVASADSAILDACERWVNLVASIVLESWPSAAPQPWFGLRCVRHTEKGAESWALDPER